MYKPLGLYIRINTHTCFTVQNTWEKLCQETTGTPMFRQENVKEKNFMGQV